MFIAGEYPSTGCTTCDRLRRIKEDPDIRCHLHRQNVSPAERKKIQDKYETLVVGDHGQQSKTKESEGESTMNGNTNGKDKQNNRGTTPKAKAMWPFVTKTSPKYQGKGQEYKITLLFDPANAEHKAFLGTLRGLVTECEKEQKAKCIHLPFHQHLDPNTKEKTSFWEVTFKSSDQYPPRLFDSRGTLITGELNMGNGSIVRVSYSYKFYNVNKDTGPTVSLYLSAVQVLEYVEYLGADAHSYGFEQEEGYNAVEKFGQEFEQGPPASDAEVPSEVPESEIPF